MNNLQSAFLFAFEPSRTIMELLPNQGSPRFGATWFFGGCREVVSPRWPRRSSGLVCIVGGTLIPYFHTVLFSEAFLESLWSPLHFLCVLAAGFLCVWSWQRRLGGVAAATLLLSVLASWAIGHAVSPASSTLVTLVLVGEWVGLVAVLVWSARSLDRRFATGDPESIESN